MNSLLGKKITSTQIFDASGKRVPVTAVSAGPCVVLKVTDKNVQLGFDTAKESSVKKPEFGAFKKAKTAPRRFVREVRKESGQEYTVGAELGISDIFKNGEYVHIRGVSKGKGFQGGMKRWNWAGGPRTHGSTSKRRVGSVGSSTTPGRVYKGHHMPGHMGNRRVTVLNLKIVDMDSPNNILLVRGAVPGPNNGYLVITKSFRKSAVDAAAASGIREATQTKETGKSKAKEPGK